MIETIKASGAENGFFEKWAGYQASVNTQGVKYVKLSQYLGMLPLLVSTISNTAILIIGVYLVMEGVFTVGMVMAFQGFLGAFTAPAQKLISAGQTIQEMRTSMERIDDVMKYPADKLCEQACENGDDGAYSKLSGNIELKNVTFGYFDTRQANCNRWNVGLRKINGSKADFRALSSLERRDTL